MRADCRQLGLLISIHTLRVEGDERGKDVADQLRLFQSTPSAWRVTVAAWMYGIAELISIHTLRMEGD